MSIKIDDDKKTVVLEGELRWATVPPNKARTVSSEYRKDTNCNDLTYSIDVECSEEDFKKLKSYKLPKLVQLKEDEETGQTFLSIKKKKRKTNLNPDRNNGEDFLIPDPQVLLQVGEGKATVLDKKIANGSKGKVKARLIEVKSGHTLQLDAVLVTELIEYVSKPFNAFGDDVEIVTDAPPSASDTETLTSDDDDDDIPF